MSAPQFDSALPSLLRYVVKNDTLTDHEVMRDIRDLFVQSSRVTEMITAGPFDLVFRCVYHDTTETIGVSLRHRGSVRVMHFRAMEEDTLSVKHVASKMLEMYRYHMLGDHESVTELHFDDLVHMLAGEHPVHANALRNVSAHLKNEKFSETVEEVRVWALGAVIGGIKAEPIQELAKKIIDLTRGV